MKKIEIYTANYCPFCIKAKNLLNKKKVKFIEINISNNEILKNKMMEITNGAKSVPQVFVNNIHIGDCNKIHQLDKDNKLDTILGLE